MKYMKYISKLTALCAALLVTTQVVAGDSIWDRVKAEIKAEVWDKPKTKVQEAFLKTIDKDPTTWREKYQYTPLKDRITYAQLLKFLSTDPNRKGSPERQKSYLNQFDLNEKQKEIILNTVKSLERQAANGNPAIIDSNSKFVVSSMDQVLDADETYQKYHGKIWGV